MSGEESGQVMPWFTTAARCRRGGPSPCIPILFAIGNRVGLAWRPLHHRDGCSAPPEPIVAIPEPENDNSLLQHRAGLSAGHRVVADPRFQQLSGLYRWRE